MDIAPGTLENAGPFACAWRRFKALHGKFISIVVDFARQAMKLGRDDPRRIIHSLKVGLAITVVSLFYYFDGLYGGFGVNAMWAVITVVVVFDFSVGATLGRGLNRAFATLFAGALGVGVHRLANYTGHKCEAILLGFFGFIVAAVVTFLRFIPKLKARYDYGLLIFILTFCLISVSGYRDDEVLEMARQRLFTILIGGATAVIICISICPVWAGDNLSNLVAGNLEKLASFLVGFEAEYFTNSGDGENKDSKSSLQGYRSVLNSKGTEESLANFAKWEPCRGWLRTFKYRHPWKQYLNIGALARQCAYRTDALHNLLNAGVLTPLEIRVKVQESCGKMSSESSNALKELATAIRAMSPPSTADSHIAKSKIAANNIKSLLKTGLWEDNDLLEIIPTATVASTFVDIVDCIEKIAQSVHELASLHVSFRSADVAVCPKQSQLIQNEIL
ncbi:hypothetical protein F0562_022385 [Nyssa sinensis]|uniref:Aluminum-activated malate transporter n=1 Tax=Nyssa sinensis TaxID=561372 RepID=A0A5J5BRK3_9ASTE|nr:hypothetical protein F0562_022385 [Nyssa sinensis]